MKKLIPVFLISAILISQAAIAETSEEVTYSGYTSNHSFSVVVPSDWRIIESGDEGHGFAPGDVFEDYFMGIIEFEGQTYEQVVDHYTNNNDNHELVYIDDIVLNSSTDLLGKHVVIKNVSVEENYGITLTKRGDVVIAITEPNLPGVENFPTPDENQEVLESIYESFKFTDGWHNYVDYKNGYTFSFPADLTVTTNSNGVTLSDDNDKEIFSVIEYANIPLEDAPEYAEDFGDSLEDTEEVSLPGAEKAIKGVFYDAETKSTYSRIFVESGEDSFSMTNVNIENNYPHPDTYDIEILEILSSFEFFTLKEDQSEYAVFFDVTEKHVNETAINGLSDSAIISGYSDGSFQPDGKINRAELTKLVVAAVTDEDPTVEDYKNCFPDVKEEWFAPYICYASEKEWVKGYMDEEFKPGRSINRVEAIKVVLEAMVSSIPEDTPIKEYEDINPDGWYVPYFAYVSNNDLIDLNHVVDSEYLPGKSMTRKEVAELIYRILNS
ncbi:S-layer homology domain-containing protein [Candidatus Peregrinibacteria bacterium]|jgi:hypothetical protein|nr:S-layer homology domain-containing protein [Candidatus Peregrinibacteria bacterium]MBT7736200.1 S-layer homology domain-containing protein [Candidatus Peregrinibacteria bacterium]